MSLRVRLVLFALAYWAGAELSYLLLSKTGDFVAFWPPAGMCLAMLLATPRPRWWAALLAAGVPNLLSDAVVHQHGLPASFGFLLVNLGAPLVGAALITRLCRPAFTFARLSHVLAWSALASLVSTPLGALFGAAVNRAFYGGAFGRKMLFWWIGDLLGVLLLTPLTYGVLNWRKWPRLAEACEMTALLLSLSATTVLVFRLPNTFALPPAVLFFFLLWAALRFGATAVAAAASVLAFIALWLTALGFGPYSFQLMMPARLLMTQMLVVTGALIFYLLAAVMAERRAAESELQTSNLRLDQQVQARTTELTAANQQLRISEERLQLGVLVADFALCEVDYTNNTNHLSPAAAQLYGLGNEEITVPREAVHATFHADDAKELAPLIAASLNPDGDGGFAREHRVVWKNGDVHWLSVRKQIFFDRTSNPPRPVRGILAAHDITERKQAEEILLENQRFTNSIIETAPSVLYTFNLKTKTNNYLTGQAAKVLGYSFEELKGGQANFIETFMHPDDALAATKHFNKIAEANNGEVFEFEYRIRQKSGEWRWFRSRDKVFKRNENGKPSEILGVALDITERKQAEEKLRESEEFNRTVLENSPDCVKILDGEGRLEFMNSNGLCLLEIDDFVPFRNKFWWELWTDETQPVVKESIEKALGGETVSFQAFNLTAKGTPKWWDVIVSPIPGADGKPSRLISVSRDITTQKRHELNLAFIAEVSADFVLLFRAEEIMESVSKRLADHLDLSRCNFSIVDEEADLIECVYAWRRDDSMPDVLGAHRITTFLSEEGRRHYAAGKFTVINDVRNSSLLNPATLEFYDELGLRSIVDAPYLKDGRWKFQMTAARSEAGEWRTDEIELIRELSERIYIRLERAHAETALRVREAELRRVQQIGEVAGLDIDVVHGLQGRRSPEYLELHGLSAGSTDHSHQDWLNRVHPQDREQSDRILQLALAGSSDTYENEYRIIRHDNGQERWIFVKAEIERDQAGKPLRIVGAHLDITKRKRAEESVRESEERFRSLFDSIDEGFCIIEMIFDENNKAVDYLFVQANPALERLTGLKDAIGKTIREMVPDLEEYWFEFYGKVALTGEAARVENEAASMNRWFEIYASRVGNSTSRVAVVFNNITERKQSEAERERLLAQEQKARAIAEAATRAKDEFIAVVSHELRNPLNSIIGYNRLLRQSGPLDSATQNKYLDIIESNARRQQTLIEDLLDTARIISGKLKLDIRPLNFVRVLQDTLDAARPTAETKQITISVELEESVLLGADITGDPDRLQQVIWNLLSNAIKFTPERGAVLVRLARAAEHVQLTVTDTGNGLSPELLPQVFDRFQQADSSSTRRHGGLGLGLALVKQLVELHGGTIAVSSPGEGQGATFTLTLPLRAVLRSEPAALPLQAAAVNPSLLTGLRVLVVDDEAEGREIITFILSTHGAEVTTVASTTAALAVLANAATKPPDLIVSDIGMPDMDGYELLRQVRQQGLLMPAIAVTAFGRTEDRLRALTAGFQMHVPKPVEADELLAVVVSLRKRESAGKK